MAIDTTSPRPRRALLSAAAGAFGALVAQAVIPRSAVDAANGDPLVLGSATNTAVTTTRLSNTSDSPVLEVVTDDSGFVNGTAISGVTTSGDGTGVAGITTSGRGVAGYAGSAVGIAVQGHSPLGIGVYAKSENAVALKVDGKVSLSRSGRTWIRAGHSTLTVNVPGTTASSRVFAVLASNRPSRYVRAVVPSTNGFTVYLNASAISDSVVTWFILD